MQNIYETVTQQVIAAMRAGDLTWQATWISRGAARNALTNRLYRGMNFILLGCTAEEKHYSQNIWAGFNQWQKLGAHVRKGEKATRISVVRKYHDTDEKSERSFCSTTVVFNIDQVDGLKKAQASSVPDFNLETVQNFAISSGAHIEYVAVDPCYMPKLDKIVMPHWQQFISDDGDSGAMNYAATLLHELIHWTGAPHRLDRDLLSTDAEHYAFEELIAELGAAFLMAALAVRPTPRASHAAYLQHWIKRLAHDPSALARAASAASIAADYLQDVTAETNQFQRVSPAAAFATAC
jgi:antirestriction protein ArdC